MKWFVVVLVLCTYSCRGLPVNKNAAQVKEKHDSGGVPTMDRQEYIRYLQELTKSDPGKEHIVGLLNYIDFC